MREDEKCWKEKSVRAMLEASEISEDGGVLKERETRERVRMQEKERGKRVLTGDWEVYEDEGTVGRVTECSDERC